MFLVSGERFGRVEEERGARGVAGEGVEDGEVKTEALAARGRRGDDEVATALGRFESFYLVAIEGQDPALLKSDRNAGIEGGHGLRLGALSGEMARRRETGANPAFGEPFVEDAREARIALPGWLHRRIRAQALALNKCSLLVPVRPEIW